MCFSFAVFVNASMLACKYVEDLNEERGLNKKGNTETITPSYYSVVLEDGFGGEILVEQSASTCTATVP